MKITSGNKSTEIIERKAGIEMPEIVKVQSSTELQPFYGINFVDGKVVGGRTLTAVQVDQIVAAAKRAGLKIEE